MQPLPRDLGGGLAALAIPVPVRTAYAAGCHAGRLLSELSYLAHALAQATPDKPFDYAAYLAHMGRDGVPCGQPWRCRAPSCKARGLRV